MEIDVDTDPGIPGREPVARVVEAELERALDPFSAWLTRVRVRLHDDDGKRPGGGAKRCVITAYQPDGPVIEVSVRAQSVKQAVADAVRRLADRLGRARDR